MERASQSELLWAYAITRDEYAKRLSEKSLLKAEDLEFIRDRIFELINRDDVNFHGPKEEERLQAVVEKYLHPTDDYISLTDSIPVFDPVTGEEDAAYLFVAVLPCSCMVYAEPCLDMKTENWLLCHVHAYNYFGGVTRLLIPDNCKTATVSNSRYDTVLNRSYQELAEHYGTAIVPARVRKPQDKSHAESSVRFAETWIIAALRDQKFFSISEVRAAVREKLEELNDRKFKQRAGSL